MAQLTQETADRGAALAGELEGTKTQKDATEPE